jgi:hypothetical protein
MHPLELIQFKIKIDLKLLITYKKSVSYYNNKILMGNHINQYRIEVWYFKDCSIILGSDDEGTGILKCCSVVVLWCMV